jgi:MFS transporter, UMF1 family
MTEPAPSPVEGSVPAAPIERLDRRRVVSWALYDLANTIYSAIVMTGFLVPLFRSRWGSATPVGLTTSVTLLASAFVSTWLGTLVDRTGRARPGLDVSTTLCCLFSAMLFFAVEWGWLPTLLCYAASLFSYQAALTFYNTLLPAVAPPSRRGFVSGLGVGLGYAGIPLALVVGKLVLDTPLGAPGAFLVSAAMMTLGTIPLWLYVKDAPTRPRRDRLDRPAGLFATLRWVRTQPLLLLLLLGTFVSADVANTLIQYATDYFSAKNGLGMSLQEAITHLIWLSVTAMLGGLVVGRVADRAPVRTYVIATTALVTALVGTALFPSSPLATGWLVLAGGVGIAAVWTVGRQLVLRVTPPEHYGEALGLYGVTTKASIVGTVVFVVLADNVGFSVAILTEAATLAAGVVLMLAFGRRFALARAAGTLP